MRLFHFASYRLRHPLWLSNLLCVWWRILGMNVGKNTVLGKIQVSWPHAVELGSNCKVDDSLHFKVEGPYRSENRIQIGDEVWIRAGCEFNLQQGIQIGDGTQTRAFSHVEDVAPIIARSPLVPEARNQIFNVGADTPYTVNELAGEIAAAMGAECQTKHLEARNEVLHAFSDHSKVNRVFQPAAPVSLKEGVRRLVVWGKANGPRTPVKFGNIEIETNLTPSWKA